MRIIKIILLLLLSSTAFSQSLIIDRRIGDWCLEKKDSLAVIKRINLKQDSIISNLLIESSINDSINSKNELNISRYISIINEKDGIITNKNTIIKEKDSVIREKDKKIKGKNTLIIILVILSMIGGAM